MNIGQKAELYDTITKNIQELNTEPTYFFRYVFYQICFMGMHYV